MSTIRAIFFDIGDTLVFDEPPTQARLGSAYASIGLHFDPALLPRAFRLAEDYALEEYVKGIPPEDPDVMLETTARLTFALGLPPLDEAQFAALCKAYMAIPFQRVVHAKGLPLLTELRRRGFKIGVVSDWEQQLPDQLREMGIAKYLDALSVSAIVGVTKPDPAIFLDAVAQIGLMPEEIVHIGDYYELDIAGARAAGLSPILFDWKQRRPECDCPRFETFDSLASYLLTLPAPQQSPYSSGAIPNVPYIPCKAP